VEFLDLTFALLGRESLVPEANFGFERTLENYDSSVVLVQKFS